MWNGLVLLPVDETLRNLINLTLQNVFLLNLICADARRESQSRYFFEFDEFLCDVVSRGEFFLAACVQLYGKWVQGRMFGRRIHVAEKSGVLNHNLLLKQTLHA